MTAEIVIMNRNGIALAADSAVTIGRERVWQTANKLFSLSPHNDIGIMIYGSGDFLGYSWETIIKSYRLTNGNKKFKTVDDCAKDFIRYLKSNKIKDTKETFSLIIFKQIFQIQKGIVAGKIDPEDQAAIEEYLTQRISEAKKQKIILSITRDVFKRYFRGIIKTLGQELLKISVDGKELKIKLSKKSQLQIMTLCYESFRRRIQSGYGTGIVIAGFGEKEYFPTLINYTIDGRYKNLFRAWREEEACHNINTAGSAAIIPFAQKDVFDLFMQGIAPNNERFLIASLNELLKTHLLNVTKKHVAKERHKDLQLDLQKNGKEILLKFINEFKHYRQEQFINPILSVVSALPKEEMAAMAEALVELTSLRRKVDSKVQSVGGPTDVAIISKGDGLVWIKRKHYFNIENNPDYVVRKQLQLQKRNRS